MSVKRNAVPAGHMSRNNGHNRSTYCSNDAKVKHDAIFRLSQIAQMFYLQIRQRSQNARYESDQGAQPLIFCQSRLQKNVYTDETGDDCTGKSPFKLEPAVKQAYSKENCRDPDRRHVIQGDRRCQRQLRHGKKPQAECRCTDRSPPEMLKRILRFERTAFDQHHTKKKNSSDQTAIHNDFRSGIRIGDELDAYCHQGKYKSGNEHPERLHEKT